MKYLLFIGLFLICACTQDHDNKTCWKCKVIPFGGTMANAYDKDTCTDGNSPAFIDGNGNSLSSQCDKK